jgi:hypothetical protein
VGGFVRACLPGAIIITGQTHGSSHVVFVPTIGLGQVAGVPMVFDAILDNAWGLVAGTPSSRHTSARGSGTPRVPAATHRTETGRSRAAPDDRRATKPHRRRRPRSPAAPAPQRMPAPDTLHRTARLLRTIGGDGALPGGSSSRAACPPPSSPGMSIEAGELERPNAGQSTIHRSYHEQSRPWQPPPSADVPTWRPLIGRHLPGQSMRWCVAHCITFA